MTQQERRGWLMVVSLFVVLLLVFGSGYNTVSVFVPALLRAFPRWSRAEVALLPSVLALSAGGAARRGDYSRPLRQPMGNILN